MSHKSIFTKSKCLFFQMDPSQIAFLKFILEGYDHLATLTVHDARRGILQISFFPTEEEVIREILKDFEISYQIHPYHQNLKSQ
ncbi:MAG: DUF4911 domain-containing protein [Caldimicrobium sp.]